MANPSPLPTVPTGWRLPNGNWFNDIIARVNGLVNGSLSQSVNATSFTQDGAETRVADTVAAAGTTIADATEIAADTSTVIVTVTASTQGVKLPVASAGKRLQVFASPTVGVLVYPRTGSTIGAGATNAGVAVTLNTAQMYQAVDAQTWRVAR